MLTVGRIDSRNLKDNMFSTTTTTTTKEIVILHREESHKPVPFSTFPTFPPTKVPSFRILSDSFPSFRLLGFRGVFRHSAIPSIRIWVFSAVLSFHHSSISPFHHSTIPPFHRSTIPVLHSLELPKVEAWDITQDSVSTVYRVNEELSTWRSQSLKRCFSTCSKKEQRYVTKFNAQ